MYIHFIIRLYRFIIFQIEFESTPDTNERLNTYDPSPIYNKVSKITAHYQEKELALRIGMINRVVRNTVVNACTDGSATCGSNSICVPDPEHDSYSVNRVFFI